MRKTVSQLKGMGDIAEQWAAMREGMFETREVEMTLDETAFKISSDVAYLVMRIPFCFVRGVWDGIWWAWRDAGIQ